MEIIPTIHSPNCCQQQSWQNPQTRAILNDRTGPITKRMLISHAVLLCSIAAFADDAATRPMETAQFRKLFRSEGELSSVSAKDNLKECAPSVRRSIRKIKNSMADFHFTCTNGVVRNIFVAEDSPMNRHPGKFMTDHLGLFGLESAPIVVRFEKDAGSEILDGKPAAGARVFRAEEHGSMIEPLPAFRPATTRDLERAAGIAPGKYFAYEIDLVAPEEVPDPVAPRRE